MHIKTFKIITIIVLLLVSHHVFAEVNVEELINTGTIVVETRLQPETEIVVGQQVHWYIEILGESWMSKAPNYPDLNVNGAVSILASPFGTNTNKTIKGKTYYGKQQYYLIYPQQEGNFTIPSIQLSFETKIDDVDELITLNTESLAFTTVIPEQVKGISSFITTTNLDVAERYEGITDELKVGDAITRTITITAQDTLGMLIPETKFASINDTKMYPAQPRIEDQSYRGQFVGKRVDAVTYMLQDDGELTLPEMKFNWFNPKNKSLQEKTLPEVKIQVAKNPNYHQQKFSIESLGIKFRRMTKHIILWLQDHMVMLVLIGITFYLVYYSIKKYSTVVLEAFQHVKNLILNSEAYYFRKLKQACKNGNQNSITKAYWNWIDKVNLNKNNELIKIFQLYNNDRFSADGKNEMTNQLLIKNIILWRKTNIKNKKEYKKTDFMQLNPNF